ncbi:hypothetical protein V8E36_008097 [Tilletia maclaganii]
MAHPSDSLARRPMAGAHSSGSDDEHEVEVRYPTQHWQERPPPTSYASRDDRAQISHTALHVSSGDDRATEEGQGGSKEDRAGAYDGYAQSNGNHAGHTGNHQDAYDNNNNDEHHDRNDDGKEDDDDDDWLHSSGDELPALTGDRTLNKIQAQFEDVGYREGITAGKLSTLQAGFDEGFSTVGAPLGRAVGQLRGQALSLCVYVGRLASELQQGGSDDSRAGARAGHAAGAGDDDGELFRRPARGVQSGPAQQQHIDLEYEGDESTTGRAKPREVSTAAASSALPASKPGRLDLFAQEDLLPGPGRARVRLKGRQPQAEPDQHISQHHRGSSLRRGPRRTSATTAAHSHLSASDIFALLNEAHALLRETQTLTLDRLAPPDEEALAHERDHILSSAAELQEEEEEGAAGGDGAFSKPSAAIPGGAAQVAAARAWRPETEEERNRREGILPALHARLHAAKAVLGLV